jgi:hypothetical protein
MSLLHIGLGLLGVGGLGGIATILLGPAKLVELAGGLLGRAAGILGWLAKNPAWLVAAACLVLAGLQYEHARHWRKVDAGDVAARRRDETVLLDVKKEVDRGVGRSTDVVQAPFYIHHFVDDLATLNSALDRQSAALRAAQRDAEARRAAAADAAKPTQTQRERERVRRQIVDLKRTSGLTAEEWGHL